MKKILLASAVVLGISFNTYAQTELLPVDEDDHANPGDSSTGITRTCLAEIVYLFPYPTEYVPAPIRVDPLSDNTFEATRGCGSSQPNECRVRARDALRNCFDALNLDPDDPLPEACRSEGVSQYQMGSLNENLGGYICDHYNNTDQGYTGGANQIESGDLLWVIPQIRAHYGSNWTGSCSIASADDGTTFYSGIPILYVCP